jgi:hypothetical protein
MLVLLVLSCAFYGPPAEAGAQSDALTKAVQALGDRPWDLPALPDSDTLPDYAFMYENSGGMGAGPLIPKHLWMSRLHDKTGVFGWVFWAIVIVAIMYA